MIESLFWITICVYFEARGESFGCQKGVAHVVMNRAERKGKSVKEVIKEPHQFEWYKGYIPTIKEFNSLIQCAESVNIALAERLRGNTFKDADHFYSTDIQEPYWAKSMKEIAHIGNMRFFKS